MKVTLCGVELELNINLTDAAEVEKWEEKAKDLCGKLTEIERRGDKFSKIIREETECVSRWLDEQFGEGIGKCVLGGRADLKDVYGILYAANNLHRIHMDQVVEEALAKYSPQRASRK